MQTIDDRIKQLEDGLIDLYREKIKQEIVRFTDERNRIIQETEKLKIAYREELESEFATYKAKFLAEQDQKESATKDLIAKLATKEREIKEQCSLSEHDRQKAKELKEAAEKEMAAALSLREAEEKEIAKIKADYGAKAIALVQATEENKKLSEILQERKNLLDDKEFHLEQREKTVVDQEEKNRQDLVNISTKIEEANVLTKLIETDSHVIKNNLAEVKQTKEENSKILQAVNEAIIKSEALKEENRIETEKLIAESKRIALIKEKTENDAKALQEKQKLDAVKDKERAEQIAILKKLREEANA